MPKQNPFSLYDFLGYFTPGALLLYGLLGLSSVIEPERNFASSLTEVWTFEKPQLLIPFVLVAYTSGHILSFLSSITVESYSVWALGYPSKYLLRHRYPRYFESVESQKTIVYGLRAAVWLLLIPITVLDLLIGQWLEMRKLYAKPLDPLLTMAITKKNRGLMTRHAGISAGDLKSSPDYDSFRYIYHWAVEEASSHFPKLQNYVALYGFLRTITLLSVAAFWVAMYLLATSRVGATVVASFAVMSFVAFLAFIKFYRRFSLEALMALAVKFPIAECDADEPNVSPG